MAAMLLAASVITGIATPSPAQTGVYGQNNFRDSGINRGAGLNGAFTNTFYVPTSGAIYNNELWVANFGNHTATVYRPKDAGDTAPIRVIRSAPPGRGVPGMGNPHPIAYDTKREQILVPN